MSRSKKFHFFFVALLALQPLLLSCNPANPEFEMVPEPPSAIEDPELWSTGWPAIYGPYHNSISSESDLETNWGSKGPRLLWEREIGQGYSSPISVGDLTFVFHRQGDEEIIECLDAETGEFEWDYRRPTNFKCGWEYSDGPYSTPVVNKRSLFAVSTQGVLFCLDLETGKCQWVRKLYEDYQMEVGRWPVVASPLLLKDRLIFNLGAGKRNAGIVAIDLENGETIWEATSHGASHATPTAASMQGEQLVFVMTDEGLVCLRPETGEVVWELEHKTRDPDAMFSNAVSPVVSGEFLTIVSGPKIKPGFRCLKLLPGGQYEEPWKNIRLLNSQYTNQMIVGGHLFGFSPMRQGGPHLHCINLVTGDLCWRGRPRIGRGNGIVIGNSILFLGETGDLCSIEIRKDKMVVTSRTESPILDRPCYTPMALNQGRLFLRNEKKLKCLDLRRR